MRLIVDMAVDVYVNVNVCPRMWMNLVVDVIVDVGVYVDMTVYGCGW